MFIHDSLSNLTVVSTCKFYDALLSALRFTLQILRRTFVYLYLSSFNKTVNSTIKMKSLLQLTYLYLYYHLISDCLAYDTGLHQYIPITSFRGIRCDMIEDSKGNIKSAETLDRAMHICDRSARCTSIATDFNFHRAFPIDERDYDNGCGRSGHHYQESFYPCMGNIYEKIGGSFDCSFVRGTIMYFVIPIAIVF